MMNIEKKTNKNLWKAALVVPLAAFLVFVFACTKTDSADNNEQSSKKQTPVTVYNTVEEMAEYPGGFMQMRQDIAKRLKYPKAAIENGVAGKVIVQFIVDPQGKIITETGDYIIDGETKQLDGVVVVAYKSSENTNPEDEDEYIDLLKQEAVRVISELPAFSKPAFVNGEPVHVSFTLPINFALQ